MVNPWCLTDAGQDCGNGHNSANISNAGTGTASLRFRGTRHPIEAGSLDFNLGSHLVKLTPTPGGGTDPDRPRIGTGGTLDRIGLNDKVQPHRRVGSGRDPLWDAAGVSSSQRVSRLRVTPPP